MLALLAALLLLHSAPSSCLGFPNSNSCVVLDWSAFSSDTSTDLNLSNHSIKEINGSAQLRGSVEMLDLSFNHLQSLPRDFLSQAHALKELLLQHNQLRELPTEFFKNATSLQSLSLQGNPLRSVPASAFQRSLLHLVVECKCDVVRSVLSHCNSPTNSTNHTCHCLSGHKETVTEFYTRECQPLCTLLCVAITSSVLAVLLLVGGLGVVLFLLRRRRQASVIHSKRESTASITRSQPRYISRNAETGPGQASDYENVFIGPSQPVGQYECLERKGPQYRVQQLVDEDCYMESDTCGDQPVYANTQQLYRSSCPAPSDAEEVYIVPDK
ncbi:cyclin-dependent kinase 5 activator 1-like [Platysternon megacephalum]|uniref:Cyclin-dependent kinase 5 activator 1-like n=1 Tax=Platysternon megacephalum TaxID=55544 RepID=A0A4D9EFK1_9SAUR|nr:cyclin-dependent kinase 5 activator 1-like [Platysternon megacephalum]